MRLRVHISIGEKEKVCNPTFFQLSCGVGLGQNLLGPILFTYVFILFIIYCLLLFIILQ